MKNFFLSRWLHPLLLLMWIILAAMLRFNQLTGKTPSTPELATLVFSLGHGFLEVPLDQVISLDTLMQPLQPDSTSGIGDVIHHMKTDPHPPTYFVLTHLWIKLFTPSDELSLLAVARSLSAILGVASIPAMFGFGWLAFRSRLVGQITAGLMAVSPYGIYLAQEARHYTLTILWLIASLCCLVVATRCLYHRTILPIWLGCIWVIVNSLGIATHYFFSLALCAEGLVIAGFWLRDVRVSFHSKSNRVNLLNLSGYWGRIYAVAAGTLIGCLVWLPMMQGISDNELTNWIETSYDIDELWHPLLRLVGWWITMVFLLPVEGTSSEVTIASGVILLVVLLWVSPAIIRGFWVQIFSELSRLSVWVLAGFFIAAIAMIFVVIYGLGSDLSLAARYHFIYFPAVIILLGAALAVCWQELQEKILVKHLLKAVGKKVVIVILLIGIMGGLTVNFNYAYQKDKRPDRLVPHILESYQHPILITTDYNTHSEIRTLIGLGWEFKRFKKLSILNPNLQVNYPQFLLARFDQNNEELATASLYKNLAELPRPLDVWTINFSFRIAPETQNCFKDARPKFRRDGYREELYHCK